jgi:Tol biopolymer transport system component
MTRRIVCGLFVFVLSLAARLGDGARAQAPAGFELTLMDGDGTKKVLGQLPPSVYAPRISPDGKWIGYISGDDLWIISPDGSVKRKSLSISKTNKNRIESYSWSPDDSRIAYIDITNGSPTPRLLDLNTGDISELLLGSPQLSLSWSPNGKYALFLEEKNWYSLSIPDGKITNLTAKLGVNFWQESTG